MLNINTPLRTIQALLAIITLGLNGYITSWYRAHTHPTTVPNESPFLLFCAAWTLLLLPYLILNPPSSPTQTNNNNPKPPSRLSSTPLILPLLLDTLTSLLWFSGSVALGVFKSRLLLCGGHVCGVMGGAIAVAVGSWICFVVAAGWRGWGVLRGRGRGKEGKKHEGWVGRGGKV